MKLEGALKTMQKYLDAGHVEFVPPNEIPLKPGKTWFLPVLLVTHPKKDKVRAVFDSSAKFKGVSLNDVLLQGPDRNNKLKGVLLRFRDGPIAVAGDVETMFHSFHLRKEDRDFVRYYWFKENDPTRMLTQMRAKVHIFGNKPSPAIANYGLRTAAARSPHLVKGKDMIENNTYVDDSFKAVDSVNEAVQVLQETRSILGKLNIRFHKISFSLYKRS